MNKLYIIGNGFDLDLGLKTSYQDFLSSPIFKEMLANNSSNQLAHYLHGLTKKDTWVDIEVALRELARTLRTHVQGTELRETDYEEVVKRLELYLSGLDMNNINKHSTAHKLAWDIAREIESKASVRIINFNYTDSVEKVLQEHDLYEEIRKKIIHPHGKIGGGGIVFGVEDGTGISPVFNYLKKSSRAGYKGISGWEQYLQDMTEVCIYGHSLGESDNMYFKTMFEFYLHDRTMHRKITVYHRKGDENMYRDRLIDLVNDNVQRFKSKNTYETIPVESK